MDWGYLDGVVGDTYEMISGFVDTSRLNKDEATVFFSNRPDVSPFSAGYRTFVSKLPAMP